MKHEQLTKNSPFTRQKHRNPFAKTWITMAHVDTILVLVTMGLLLALAIKSIGVVMSLVQTTHQDHSTLLPRSHV